MPVQIPGAAEVFFTFAAFVEFLARPTWKRVKIQLGQEVAFQLTAWAGCRRSRHGVAQLVLLQSLQVHKGLTTYATGEGGLTTVGGQVGGEGVTVGKKGPTFTLIQSLRGTCVWRLARWATSAVLLGLFLLLPLFLLVFQALHLQNFIILLDLPSTNMAGWRPVLGMCEFVALQEGRSIKVPLTVWAFKGFDVGMGKPMAA